MEMKTIQTTELPPGISPDAFLEQQQRKAAREELKVLGPRSKRLVTEIEKLEAARAERLAQDERLVQEVSTRADALNALRASSLIEEVDRDRMATLEHELVDLQRELDETRGWLAGLDVLLSEKREALGPAQLEDVEEAVSKNGKALAKTCKVFLQTLEVGAKAMQEAGLMKERERWQDLIAERHQHLYQLYELTGGSDDRADRQIRAELVGTYGLFSGDVPEIVLQLASCLIDLFEVREGRPSVRRK